MAHIRKPSPDTGTVAAKPSEGASVSRYGKTGSYKTVVNTCLPFLNEGEKWSGIEW